MEPTNIWRKSSRSGQGNACVELRGDLRAVRDSKNAAGPALTVSVTGLLEAAKAGFVSR